MNKLKAMGLLVGLGLLASCGSQDQDPAENMAVDSVYFGGKIYTANDEQPTAELVGVKDGRIVYVGDEAGLGNLIGDETKIYNLIA